MSNETDHQAEQDAITAQCEAGTCDHPECHEEQPEQLDDMKCPNCGQTEAFHIAATVWGNFTADGFDPDAWGLPDHNNDWTEYDACICPQCKKTGIVQDFQI